MSIGSLSYRLFVKEIHAQPYFKEGHYSTKMEAVSVARSWIASDTEVEWINVYEQVHVKRFARTQIIEEG